MTQHVEQPTPTHQPGVPSVQAAVRRDLEAREHLGIARYGTPLQPFNNRDALRDAYEEAIDLTVYLKQVLIERDARTDINVRLAEVTDIIGIPSSTPWPAVVGLLKLIVSRVRHEAYMELLENMIDTDS